jgi:hypothetical protein
MKTKVYEVGYWSHEESPRYLFTNKDEYTQEEFNTIITDIVKEILEKHKEKKDNYYKKITFEWILEDVIEALKKTMDLLNWNLMFLFSRLGGQALPQMNGNGKLQTTILMC